MKKSDNSFQSRPWVQFIKFTLFSISAGIIQTLSFALLDWLTPWTYWPMYLIALVLSVLWNFTFNRQFTFKDSSNVPLSMILVAVYYSVFTPLSTWWGNSLADIHWNYYIILAMTMLINFVTEFLYDKFVVFRHPRLTVKIESEKDTTKVDDFDLIVDEENKE